MSKKMFLNLVSEKLNELNAKEVITASANVKLFEELKKLINQLDESQKVVIPRLVADKIEYCKKESGYGLFHTMDYCFGYQESAEWLEDNQETFARAWLDGYEVEQKKLYTVEIPNPHSVYEATVLSRNKHDNIVIEKIRKGSVLWRDNEDYQLTEAEIKQDFEWAWQWAVEVE